MGIFDDWEKAGLVKGAEPEPEPVPLQRSSQQSPMSFSRESIPAAVGVAGAAATMIPQIGATGAVQIAGMTAELAKKLGLVKSDTDYMDAANYVAGEIGQKMTLGGEAGQKAVEGVMTPFAKWSELSEKTADVTYEGTKSPALGAGVRAVMEAVPYGLGYKAVKGLQKAPKVIETSLAAKARATRLAEWQRKGADVPITSVDPGSAPIDPGATLSAGRPVVPSLVEGEGMVRPGLMPGQGNRGENSLYQEYADLYQKVTPEEHQGIPRMSPQEAYDHAKRIDEGDTQGRGWLSDAVKSMKESISGKEIKQALDKKSPIATKVNEVIAQHEQSRPVSRDYDSGNRFLLELGKWQLGLQDKIDAIPEVSEIIQSVPGMWNVERLAPDGKHLLLDHVDYPKARKVLIEEGNLNESRKPFLEHVKDEVPEGMFSIGNSLRVTSDDGFVTRLVPMDKPAQKFFTQSKDFINQIAKSWEGGGTDQATVISPELPKPLEAKPEAEPSYKVPFQHQSDFKNGQWLWPENETVPLYHDTNANIGSIIKDGIKANRDGVYALQAPQTTPESFKLGRGHRYTIEFNADFSGGKEPIKPSSGKFADTAYQNPENNIQDFTGINYKGIWRGYKDISPESISLIYDNKEGKIVYKKLEEPPSAAIPTQPTAGGAAPETGITKLSRQVELAAIEKDLIAESGIENKTPYDVMNLKAQAQAHQDLLSDWDLSKKIVFGEAKAPADVRLTGFTKAVGRRAVEMGDMDTITRLATEVKTTTEAGQELASARSARVEADPIEAIKEITKTKTETVLRTTGRKVNQPEKLAAVRKARETVAATEKAVAENLAKSEEINRTAAIEDLVAKPQAEAKPVRDRTIKYGARNKVVTIDDYTATKKALNDRLSGQMRTGIDPQDVADMGKIGMYHFEAGSRAFADWSKMMIGDLKEFVKPHLEALWDTVTKEYGVVRGKDLTDRIAKSYGKSEDLELLGRHIQAFARHLVETGVRDRNTLITEVHKVLQDIIPDITPRETMDAISGYGKYKQLTKDEISTTLRDLKGQMQQVGKLEDIQKRTPPKKTGVERRVPSVEERSLIKQVEDAKRRYGVETTDKETQLKSALDSIKTRLTHQIEDLGVQISTGQKFVKNKTSVVKDAEALKLVAIRDALREEYNKVFATDSTMSEKAKIKLAERAIGKSISEYERRIRTGDWTPAEKKTPLTSPTLVELRTQRDSLKLELKRLKDIANPKRTPDQIALETLKTRLKNKTDELETRMKTGDYSKKVHRMTILDVEAKQLKAENDRAKFAYKELSGATATVTPEQAAHIVDLSKVVEASKQAMESGGNRFDYGAAKVAFNRYVEHLKGFDAPIADKLRERFGEFKQDWSDNKPRAVLRVLGDSLKEMSDISISMVATLDNSFLGRQGIRTLMTHPTVWAKGAYNSFADFAKTLGGRETMDALWADVYSRENYINGRYTEAGILAKTEEQFPTSLPGRVPIVGRVLKASEHAFTGSGLRMRTDLFDLLSRNAERNGVDMSDAYQLQSYGKLINSLTARGQWGSRGEPAAVRLLIWAPKMLKGNIDVLTMHAGQKMSWEARMQAVENLAKIIGSTAILLTTAEALAPGSVEKDPRSANFGKIKVGDTRFDVTGGAASLVTLGFRIGYGLAGQPAYKSSSTGILRSYDRKYGAPTMVDTLVDFGLGKATPMASAAITYLNGMVRLGKEVTPKELLYRSVTPISLQNFINLKDNASADRVVGALVDIIGISATSYGASEKDWNVKPSKDQAGFKEKVGVDEFKAANKEYNDSFNEWFGRVSKDSGYQTLPSEDQMNLLRQKKAELEKMIFREHDYHPRPGRPVRANPIIRDLLRRP